MSTFQERADQTTKILTDKDLNLTLKEGLVYWYNWCQYEISNHVYYKADRRRAKYGKKLNRDIAVYNLRINLKDL